MMGVLQDGGASPAVAPGGSEQDGDFQTLAQHDPETARKIMMLAMQRMQGQQMAPAEGALGGGDEAYAHAGWAGTPGYEQGGAPPYNYEADPGQMGAPPYAAMPQP